jgi:hypothetical protein
MCRSSAVQAALGGSERKRRAEMKHPLTLHEDPDLNGAFIVNDVDGVWVGTINPNGAYWSNHHPVEKGQPFAPYGPFQTVDTAFAAFQATP